MSGTPSRKRLALRDLAALSAFGSMAVSGQIPLPIAGLVVVGFVLALLGRRPFGDRGRLGGLFLMLMAALAWAAVWLGQVDLVVGACTFAALLCLQRVLSAPTRSVDSQVHLSSLLLVAGGAALSGDLLYAPALALYAAFSTLSMGLGVVEAAAPDDEPLPSGALARPLAIGVVLSLTGALAFFFLFPRLSWNVANRRATPGLGPATTGFSDGVRLGGSGTIKSNPRVIARITLAPDPGRETLGAYWIGRTFDAFDGISWVTFAEDAGAPTDQLRLTSGGDGLVHQTVELLPAYGAQTALALESPSLFGGATAHLPQGNRRTPLELLAGGEVRFAQRALGYSYHAYSLPPERQTALPPTTGAQLARAVALPPGLDPRVSELAARVVAGEKDPLRAGELIATHLRTNYAYTLELPGTQPDPLADFLFERREGHCEHFATALAVMLRTQGFRARLAGGFYGGERVGDSYLLRAGDAHAWTQVFVPGRGWVSLDATPPAYRGARPQALLAWLVDRYEQLEEAWRDRFVDYSIRDQWEFVRELRRPSAPPEDAAAARVQTPRRAWLFAAFAAAGVLLVGWIWERRGARTGPLPATRFHADLERCLRGAPWIGRAPDEPLEEFSRRLSERHHAAAPALDSAVTRYLAARFGGRALRPGEAARLLGELEAALRQAEPRAGAPGPRPPRTA